ncbi:unnamed protein product [Thelazia callipaeda]|uniref:Secreted protein n=1 Tax=Thelazia callipaeda TaxID=103827 RepID=A0A0N5DAI1_THECL|nr:unnamed protein product [Thelazia callipaeda]
MHSTLVFLALSVFAIVQVQSQAPDGCQKAIDSLNSILAKIAVNIDPQHVDASFGDEYVKEADKVHGEVSQLAKMVQELQAQKTEFGKKASGSGSRAVCLKGISDLQKELMQLEVSLKALVNLSKQINAEKAKVHVECHNDLLKEIDNVGKMLQKRDM